MKAAPTLALIHGIASLNPYSRPLQTGRRVTRDDPCAFCGAPMNAPHDPTCLWERAIRLFDELVPIENYRADDYR